MLPTYTRLVGEFGTRSSNAGALDLAAPKERGDCLPDCPEYCSFSAFHPCFRGVQEKFLEEFCRTLGAEANTGTVSAPDIRARTAW